MNKERVVTEMRRILEEAASSAPRYLMRVVRDYPDPDDVVTELGFDMIQGVVDAIEDCIRQVFDKLGHPFICPDCEHDDIGKRANVVRIMLMQIALAWGVIEAARHAPPELLAQLQEEFLEHREVERKRIVKAVEGFFDGLDTALTPPEERN